MNNIHRSAEDTPATKTLSAITFNEVAICAVKVAILRKRNKLTLFSHLDTDVVHSIFGTTLDMDQIHDPNFSLHNLDIHRRQINRMRRVSTMWNRFLLSSPRYWQVLNIKSPPPMIAAGLKRSGAAPLCIYCIRDLTPPAPDQLGLELVLSAARVQTLRSDDPDAYRLCRVLLGTRTSSLRTLQLIGLRHAKRSIEPLRDLSAPSPIHHLTAVGWRPASRGAVWLMDLKELILHDLTQLDAELLLVLSACVNLKRLVIQCVSRSDVQDLSGAPSTIILPCLQTMDLIFESDKSATNLTRRMATPQLLRASLDVGSVDLNDHRADYCQFVSQDEGCAQYPNFASIFIEEGDLDDTSIIYETESRRLAFQVSGTREQVRAFHDLVQEFQALLQEPTLSAKSSISLYNIWIFVKSLHDQNVRTIEAHLGEYDEDADDLLKVIGALRDPLYRFAANATTDQLFKSLKSIVIHAAKFDLKRFTAQVEGWLRYLQRKSMRWPEEIDLVGYSFEGMKSTKAVKKLAAMGVTLRCIRCFNIAPELWC